MALTQVASGLIASVSASTLTGTQTIPKATLPTGSVLQVVSATTSTNTSTTSTSYVTAGVAVSITPLFSTSKVLVTITGGQCDYNATQAIFTIYRGSTDLALNAYGFACFYNTATAEMQGPLSGQYLDSPATTSSTTYTIYFKRGAGSGTVYIGTNGNSVTISAMEIAA